MKLKHFTIEVKKQYLNILLCTNFDDLDQCGPPIPEFHLAPSKDANAHNNYETVISILLLEKTHMKQPWKIYMSIFQMIPSKKFTSMQGEINQVNYKPMFVS